MIIMLENFVEPINLFFRFIKMRPKTCRKIAVGGLLDHLRHRLRNLVLDVINVLQAVQK